MWVHWLAAIGAVLAPSRGGAAGPAAGEDRGSRLDPPWIVGRPGAGSLARASM